MKNSILQYVIIGIFAVFAIIAFLIFSGAIKIGKNVSRVTGTVEIWGTIPFRIMQPFIERTKTQRININYKQKDIENFEDELVNSLAAGIGPDLFIVPHDIILRHGDKIFEIPYASYPQDLFKKTFITEGRLFLTGTGTLALPLIVDPLVMYSNNDLISSAFLVDTPKTWDEFSDFTASVTEKTETGAIITSGVSLGTYNNIRNAKALTSILMMQNGNAIVGIGFDGKTKASLLSYDSDLSKIAEDSLDFYTSFADTQLNNYSWNESIVESQDKFISGDLGIYFGFASELEDIRKKNANLNFDLSLLPQVKDSKTKMTFGKMSAVAVSKNTRNLQASITTIFKLADTDISKDLSDVLHLPPTRLDVLRNLPDESYKVIFYQSAIISRAWFDPDPQATELMFSKMIRDVNSGAESSENALRRANGDLNRLLNQIVNRYISS